MIIKASSLLPGTSLTPPITVPDERILEIRNFTQNGGTIRGTVIATITGQPPATVLTAALLPADNMNALEPINSVVIAGPATVAVNCDSSATTCFVSYRKVAE